MGFCDTYGHRIYEDNESRCDMMPSMSQMTLNDLINVKIVIKAIDVITLYESTHLAMGASLYLFIVE